MNDKCTSVDREEKHMSIYHATNGIEELLNRIKALKYRVSGPEPEEAPKLGSTDNSPILVEVLDNTRSRINDYVNQGLNLIDEIEGALF